MISGIIDNIPAATITQLCICQAKKATSARATTPSAIDANCPLDVLPGLQFQCGIVSRATWLARAKGKESRGSGMVATIAAAAATLTVFNITRLLLNHK